MTYKMEELVPIVAILAKEYTAGESTSRTYEKAQQLMGAVIYCINERERGQEFSLMEAKEQSAKEAYNIGLRLVENKIKESLDLYNELMKEFCCYENECLNDTVVKGMAEFFKWYDCKYQPQDSILTLDYPILKNLQSKQGIDRIYDYLQCIELEQKFLKQFPREYVVEVLEEYSSDYRFMIENLCEIMLLNMVKHLLVGKGINDLSFATADNYKMQKILQQEQLGSLKGKLKGAVGVIVDRYFEKDDRLMEYLSYAIDEIAVRLKATLVIQ